MINDFFDQIYCYTLPDEKKRIASCEKEFERNSLNVEFFPAVDMRGVEKKINSVAPVHLGISKTVINIIKDARERGFKKILLFQNDVIFENNFCQIFKDNISLVPEDWDFLSLGCWSSSLPIKVNGRIEKSLCPTLDHALGISEKIFDRYEEELSKMDHESDVTISKMIREDPEINYYFFKPYIATQGEFYSSFTKQVEFKKECN